MKEQLSNLIESKCPGAKPLYLVIRGSHAYGTNLPTSDIDYSGIFIQPLNDILGNKYIEQINDDKNDIVIYELRRFLELLGKNNPTVLELLNTPDDCIIYKDPVFDEILKNKDNFITKICAFSFGGYAKTQIQKAKGQDKKQNWEKERVTRKDILDFVYVIEGEKSIPWKTWNSEKGYEEKFCGVVNVPNAKDIYTIYFDKIGYSCFGETMPEDFKEFQKNIQINKNEPMGLGYKGLVKIDESSNSVESNQLRLSSIPKGETPICIIIYNKDAYTQHCKDYASYQTWLKEKNEARWIDVKSHGQKIDGKNMMHCRRLIDMARDIAEGKGIIVRRPNAAELIAIRKGEVDLQTLINRVEGDIIEIDKLFAESTLPDNVDNDFIHNLIINIRKQIYKI